MKIVRTDRDYLGRIRLPCIQMNILIYKDKVVLLKRKRILYGIFIVAYIVLIFFLTFQGEKDTVALSDGVNRYVQDVGIIIPEHKLRS